jgi:hypothetical protein
MVEIKIPDMVIKGSKDLQHAFDTVFSQESIRKAHDDHDIVFDTKKWGNHIPERNYEFKVKLNGVPPQIMKFLAGHQDEQENSAKIRVSARQQLHKISDLEWHLTNKLRFHFLGAELFKVHPVFFLKKDVDKKHVTLSGRIKHDAFLPPPIGSLAANFMAMSSKREIRRMASHIDEHSGDCFIKNLVAEWNEACQNGF